MIETEVPIRKLPAGAISPIEKSPWTEEGAHRRRRVDVHRHVPMLKDHVPYHDLGGDYFDRRDKSVMAKRLINNLNALGFQVEVCSAT